ncbi:hypothetical protein [Aurantibacillus circumpalustris]|uniref:hypothetical protein n=1 Tax=Aurantibacillus circumpalustris TaxID=3036359 RepID=UPI00295B0C0B|nr:hypothetical protein [Aurantibacillus circumpalustris]
MEIKNKEFEFKIVEDVAFTYDHGRTYFLTLIRTRDKYLLEVTDSKKIYGRRLKLDKSIAIYVYEVFKKQLQRQTNYAIVDLCLKNCFSYKTVRETVLAMRLYDQTFHFSTIEKIIKKFSLEVKYIHEDELVFDIKGKKLTIEIGIPNKKNKFGYFKGVFDSGIGYRFYFYPKSY